MLRKFLQWLKYRKTRHGLRRDDPVTPLTQSLETEKRYFTRALGSSTDIKLREFTVGKGRFLLVFIDGLVSSELLNEAVLKPLLASRADPLPGTMRELSERLVAACDVQITGSREEALDAVLAGDAVLLADGCREACAISSKGFDKRGVEKAENEPAVRGPKESFTENLRTNTSLLRRKIRSGALVFENFRKGEQTHTYISLVYVRGIANPELLQEVRRRLARIRIDMIPETGYVEQLIEDAPLSIFATLGYTEKPDVAAAKLLEGRVAILVDGAPFALTAPYLLIEAFQNPEDYYTKPFYVSLLRLFRIFAFLVSIFAPALFVALTTFHQELIPTALLFTMAAAQDGIPFTAFTETVVMMLIFEVLKEAGVRLPKAIGQTISIVGALVMGDAAVAAGLVGAPLVIVIAFTAVCGFAVPMLNDQETLLRWGFLLLTALFGGFGISVGAILLVIHLVSLRSFGFAYLSPFAPLEPSDLKDTVFRAPLWLMRRRPVRMARQNAVREDTPIPGAEPDGAEEATGRA